MDTQTRSTLPPPPLPPLSDTAPPPVPPGQMPPREVPPPPPPEETARSAALWLGGTGAFLLLVAAAVLVAVRWDDLTAWMKLGGLLVANAAVLGTGLRLRQPLPATSRALYHLGALLVPISVVAIGVQAGVPWQYTLLGASLVTTSALLVLDRIEPAPALRWIALAAVVPAAGGLGALTSMPAGLILAAASIGTMTTRPGRHSPLWFASISWASVSASLAFLIAIDDPFVRTATVLADLGLGPEVASWAHAVTGLIAAATLAVAATRAEHDGLAVGAVSSGIGGVIASAVQLGPSDQGVLVAVATFAVAFELAALGLAPHRLWGRISAGVASLGELAMAAALFVLTGQVVDTVIDGVVAPASTAASAGLLLVAWFVADQRRRTDDCQSTSMALLTGGGWWPATVGMAGSTLFLAAALTGSAEVVSWTAAGLAAVLVASGRAGGHASALGVAWLGIALSSGGWPSVVVTALASTTLAWAASLRHAEGDRSGVGAHLLLLGALTAWLTGAIELGNAVLNSSAVSWVAWVVGAALLTLVAERASTDPVHASVGLIGRGALAITFIPALLGATSASMLTALILLSGLIGLDFLRSGDRRLAYSLAISLPATVVVLANVAELTAGETGIALGVFATAAVGAMVTLGHSSGPASAVAAVYAMAGLLYSATEVGAFSTVLLILGGAGLLVGMDRVSLPIVFGSAVTAIVGFWLRLGLAEVTWSEAYVAPVAALMVLSGIAVSGSSLRSWWTHGAAVAFLGGAALAERVLGGPGQHAVLAGAVGVGAIMIGGQRRLIGPLVVGTALVVAVSAHESLAYTAQIPTWGWLALGGSTLLSAGIAIERTATSPLESGRRVLQTVSDAFG